jgi:hypothetical protein
VRFRDAFSLPYTRTQSARSGQIVSDEREVFELDDAHDVNRMENEGATAAAGVGSRDVEFATT